MSNIHRRNILFLFGSAAAVPLPALTEKKIDHLLQRLQRLRFDGITATGEAPPWLQ